MPKLPDLSPWVRHQLAWKDCKRCPLCEDRSNIVLARGSLPCDVLFIGEAPGESENVLGKPFCGPAGHLLDTIIEDSIGEYRAKLAFTNLIACIPREEDGKKLAQPPKESILACAPRVVDFAKIASPRLIVCVGKLSTEWVRKIGIQGPLIDIVHPAAILRAPIQQKGLMSQRACVILRDGFDTHVVPF